jgi:hypothetical protein
MPQLDPPQRPPSICELCHAIVEPADPDVEFAKKVVRTGTMGHPNAKVLGMGVWFHTRCYPHGSPHYKRTPKPA